MNPNREKPLCIQSLWWTDVTRVLTFNAIGCSWRKLYFRMKARAEYLADIPLARLQFPDGTVPSGTEDCAAGWMAWHLKTATENAILRRMNIDQANALQTANDECRRLLDKLIPPASEVAQEKPREDV